MDGIFILLFSSTPRFIGPMLGPFYDQSRGTNYFLFIAPTILVWNVVWRCAGHNVLINAPNFQFDLSEKQQSEAL